METILSAVIIAFGNFGAIAFLMRKYIRLVDQHNESIPAILATLKAIDHSIETNCNSIKELYETRRNHGERIKSIETVHDVKGCT